MPDKNRDKLKGIFDCSILFVKNLTDDIYLMRLQCPQIARSASPGQFINIKVKSDYPPLLRKPFSICQCHSEEGWIEILWKIVGKGTEILSRYQSGDRINLLGPLGRGFILPAEIKKAILVAGGIGAAPFPFLGKALRKAGIPFEIFLGAKSAQELALVDEFKQMAADVFISTEDGSLGERGLVTESLQKRLKQMPDLKDIHLFSCGPTGLLRCMSEITEQWQIDGQISIETMMGCGFGICMGCPVQVKTTKAGDRQYKLTCVEGPVFNAREIVLHD